MVSTFFYFYFYFYILLARTCDSLSTWYASAHSVLYLLAAAASHVGNGQPLHAHLFSITSGRPLA